MPRLNIIMLERTPDDVRVALWADVPAARQTFYANINAKSAWVGATTADNTALQNGSVSENVVVQRVPPGATLAQVQGFLQTQWQNYQTYINNFNPWNHYGSTWDGITWAMVTVN